MWVSEMLILKNQMTIQLLNTVGSNLIIWIFLYAFVLFHSLASIKWANIVDVNAKGKFEN